MYLLHGFLRKLSQWVDDPKTERLGCSSCLILYALHDGLFCPFKLSDMSALMVTRLFECEGQRSDCNCLYK